jgi:alpha-tubulin suppressor-like RCC1 family protein
MRTYFVSRSFGLFAAVIFGGAGIVARAGGVAPADATLSSLAVSAGTLTPSFAPGVTSYTDNVPTLTEFLTVTPTAADPAALITVNGTPVASGTASAPLALAWGDNPIIVVVSALNGTAVGYAINAIRPASLSFAFASADAVAVTADGYAATGKTAALSLGFAPAVGTRLTVVNNTGGSPIIGRFANLAQDQTITLPFGNARFRFTANYFGGTGNDLVLEWGIHTAYGWGKNTNGQLGNGGTSNGLVPGAISPGALAGKTVVALALGASHSLALCADGTLAAWGANNDGQLGNGTTTSSSVPVAVTATGALAGKFVTAIAASTYHNLALCTDGTVVAWGDGSYGQLGNGGTADSNVPVPVTTTTGVLAGQKVVALATGASHSLALCADGTLATWGNNLNGQLGNGTTNNSSLPEAVTATGVLAGRTPIAIVAGFHHNLALCSNGTVVAWGYGGYFNLGNGSTENRSVPVNVTTTGVLAGRAVATIAAGGNHNLALCTDGTLVSWGFNPRGQLGNTGTTNSSLPVLVTTTSGALVGKTVAAIGAGGSHSYAISSDGSLAAWGDNGSGQLGDNSTTSSSVPVAVATSTLPNGTRIGPLAVGSQASHTMALMALPLSSNSALAGLAVSPGVFEQAFAPGATGYSVRVLHGTTAVRLTPTAADADAAVTVNGIRVVSGTASPPVPWSPGNPPVTVRVTAQNGNSTDYQVTFREDATLAGLSLSSGSPTPTLAPGTTSYTAHVGTATTAVAVTPTATDPAATITVNGQAVASGSASEPISLAPGTTPITVAVTATDGTTVSYTIIVLRPGPLDFTFTAPGDVAATWVGYTATGNTVNLTLGFTPAGPVNLTVIDNTGPNPVVGRFANLAQGQVVNFIRNGITYSFVADYYGGTGNDLVLRWAITKAYAWGYNTSGQLGNGTTTNGSLPAAVTSTGILAGRTISTLARGDSHSLALCTDGTLAAWGSNTYGQLGTGNKVASTVPVAVVTTGTLAGKTIISIAAGTYHSLALCADGTVVGWGRSGSGQIGASDSTVPVAMPATGALAGKTVIGIAAGCLHSLALCADGCLVGWGWNGKGQLGNGRTDSVVSIPVAVTTSGVLAGKTVLAIAAG